MVHKPKVGCRAVALLLILIATMCFAFQMTPVPSHSPSAIGQATPAPPLPIHHEDTAMSLSHMESVVTILAFIFVLITSIGSYVLGLRQMNLSRDLSRQQIEASLESAKSQWKVQLIVAKAQVIAPMRQAWINKLRERISAFIARVGLIAVQSDGGTRDIDTKVIVEVAEISQEILLLLHAGEPEHDAIAAKVIQLLATYRSVDFNERGKLTSELRLITQKVLKEEWDVTKRMESDTLAL